jgi:hypothetical protein
MEINTVTRETEMAKAMAIDETGMSELTIKHRGREAAMRKVTEWFDRAEALAKKPTKSAARSRYADIDICVCGKVGCDCGGR